MLCWCSFDGEGCEYRVSIFDDKESQLRIILCGRDGSYFLKELKPEYKRGKVERGQPELGNS